MFSESHSSQPSLKIFSLALATLDKKTGKIKIKKKEAWKRVFKKKNLNLAPIDAYLTVSLRVLL